MVGETLNETWRNLKGVLEKVPATSELSFITNALTLHLCVNRTLPLEEYK